MGTPVICVGIQYRLGWLGFLACKDFEEENEHYQDHLGPGNWGIIDQRNAFLWIKKNISAFGGDPNNVTAFGVSPFPVSPTFPHIFISMSMLLISFILPPSIPSQYYCLSFGIKYMC